MQDAVGFYWTLPVPWAGFSSLPEDVEEAAKVSRTIRYQTVLIREFAKKHGYRLIAEKVFLELEPDRASPFIAGPLEKALELCRAKRAVFLYVDFSHEQGWRSHMHMDKLLANSSVEAIPVSARAIEADGTTFDPYDHFSAWRERYRQWQGDKKARTREAASRALALRNQGLSYAEIAEVLNCERLVTPTGKLWTGENVRKLLAKVERS